MSEALDNLPLLAWFAVAFGEGDYPVEEAGWTPRTVARELVTGGFLLGDAPLPGEWAGFRETLRSELAAAAVLADEGALSRDELRILTRLRQPLEILDGLEERDLLTYARDAAIVEAERQEQGAQRVSPGPARVAMLERAEMWRRRGREFAELASRA